MKSICLVIPYFGKFPSNFNLFLKSCSYNSTIDFLIITDDKGNYDYPPNVKVIYKTFEELRKLIQRNYDFKINLNNPYKLCDYKPAYGEIFNFYLQNYDFWGYCDVDLMFGNIRSFITDDLLENYEKIFSRGHLTLFKNNIKMNTIYKNRINGKEKYKEVFSNAKNYAFDEWGKDGINHICNLAKIKFYDEILFSDIYIGKYAFYISQLMKRDKKYNSPCILIKSI